jgi:hypothetical protein
MLTEQTNLEVISVPTDATPLKKKDGVPEEIRWLIQAAKEEPIPIGKALELLDKMIMD